MAQRGRLRLRQWWLVGVGGWGGGAEIKEQTSSSSQGSLHLRLCLCADPSVLPPNWPLGVSVCWGVEEGCAWGAYNPQTPGQTPALDTGRPHSPTHPSSGSHSASLRLRPDSGHSEVNHRRKSTACGCRGGLQRPERFPNVDQVTFHGMKGKKSLFWRIHEMSQMSAGTLPSKAAPDVGGGPSGHKAAGRLMRAAVHLSHSLLRSQCQEQGLALWRCPCAFAERSSEDPAVTGPQMEGHPVPSAARAHHSQPTRALSCQS